MLRIERKEVISTLIDFVLKSPHHIYIEIFSRKLVYGTLVIKFYRNIFAKGLKMYTCGFTVHFSPLFHIDFK